MCGYRRLARRLGPCVCSLHPWNGFAGLDCLAFLDRHGLGAFDKRPNYRSHCFVCGFGWHARASVKRMVEASVSFLGACAFIADCDAVVCGHHHEKRRRFFRSLCWSGYVGESGRCARAPWRPPRPLSGCVLCNGLALGTPVLSGSAFSMAGAARGGRVVFAGLDCPVLDHP